MQIDVPRRILKVQGLNTTIIGLNVITSSGLQPFTFAFDENNLGLNPAYTLP